MPQVTQRKQRTPHAVGFDGLDVLTFAPVTLAASVANTAVQAITLAPTVYKFYRLMAVLTGTVAGTCAVNVVAGVAAEAGVGTPDTRDNGANAYPIPIATAGTQLLATDTALTMTTNAVTQIDLPADLFDVCWKGLLTLRVTTGASTTGTLNVALLGKQTDTNPPQGSYGSIAIGSYAGQGNFTPAIAIP